MVLQYDGGQLDRVYSPEMNNIAFANTNAVLSGCAVTQSTPQAMTVEVATGQIFFTTEINAVDVTAQTETIDGNTTNNDRLDLIVINSSGTTSVIKGTSSILPIPPNYDPTMNIVLALITVGPGTTVINSDNIKDIRVINVGGGGRALDAQQLTDALANANQALSNAQDAVADASNALSSAQMAQSTANSADTTAQNAQSISQSTQITANNAINTANSANSNANMALNTANSAFSDITQLDNEVGLVITTSVNHASVNVTSSSTLIRLQNTNRGNILIRNNGNENIYIGGSNVTTSTGFKLEPNESYTLCVTNAVYGITSSGTVDVRYLEAQ